MSAGLLRRQPFQDLAVLLHDPVDACDELGVGTKPLDLGRQIGLRLDGSLRISGHVHHATASANRPSASSKGQR